MRILITGSNGLLGQHLIKLLKQNNNHRIIATARGGNRLKDQNGYQYISLDICDETQVKKVIADNVPDVIIHCAAMTQVDDCEIKKEQCWRANVLATQYLIKAAQQIKSSFLLVSTDFIFNGESGPYDENALPDPLSYYGMSKLAAEMLLMTSQLRWAIARTVLVYGIAEDMSRSNIILWVKKSLEQGKKIRVVDDQWRTPTLVQDLAMGCQLITEKFLANNDVDTNKISGIFNISGRDFLTPYEMALKTADYFHLDKSLIEKADASSFTQTAKRPPKTGFIIDKAGEMLGYKPHSFGEGIKIMGEELIAEK
ncbi:MAG: SDR family oxidoreductase [Chitinophagaceae bacterium]|nr:MAG: SDR family oxidoreductase [Chitinophagaceae bacterium]